MRAIDIFSGVLAVILLTTIAYFSITTFTKVVKEEVVVIEEREVEIERIVTKVDTVWQYKDYRDDIILNEYEMLVSKNFLFHMAEDNVIANQIRDALPFGEVFNWWRDQLGPCGVFEWNDSMYVTLYKEETVDACEHIAN
jgi:hypothetical protein